MAFAVDPETREIDPTRPIAALGELGWLAVSAGASLGAGAIHAAAVSVHSEHQQAALVFTVVAAVQLGFAALLLARPGRVVMALAALVNVGAVAGFVLAKTAGVSFVDGLEVSEPVQAADGLAAGLAAIAVLAVGAHLLRRTGARTRRHTLFTGGAAVLVAALGVPGMLAADDHVHEGSDGHEHEVADAAAVPDEPISAIPARRYDPTLPIDLGGVEGVTPQQQAAAENLLSATIVVLPQFSDPAAIETMGFVSIGDGFTGHEHYLNQANMTDDRVLDPYRPESLVFDTSFTPKRLVAAMFMLQPGDTLADVPELGGKLTQWHVHDNLCFAGPRVAGLTDDAGQCPAGLTKGAETPMIHVWIVPHPCGPFAALEGVAGGTIAEGEERLCDHVHG